MSKVLTAFADFGNGGAIQHKVSLWALQKGKLTGAPDAANAGVGSCYAATALSGGGFAYCNKDGLFVRRNGQTTSLADVQMTSPAIFCHPKNNIVVFSQQGVGTYVLAEEWAKVSQQGFDSLAFHNERLFGVCGNQLHFTSSGRVNNWSGTVTLPCNCTAVTTCGNSLYILGEKLLKANFRTHEQNSKIVTVMEHFPQAIARTVASVGHHIWFLSNSGLLRCNGRRWEEVPLGIKLGNAGLACAAAFCGRYFLACATGEEQQCNVLVEVDCGTAKVVCYRDALCNFISGNEQLLFGNGTALTLVEELADFCWKSKPFNFGTDKRKYFRSLSIATSAPAKVTLQTSEGEKTYYFEGSASTQQVRVGGMFSNVTVLVSAVAEAEVQQLCLTALVPTGEEIYG